MPSKGIRNPMKKNGGKAAVVIDGSYISFEAILAVAKDGIPVSISKSKAFVQRMAQSQTALTDAMQKGVAVYGVNTGYGKSCGNRISMKTALKNGANIFRFHGCGTGDPIGIEETRAAMLTRIICLARGYSGVSIGLLQQMAEFLNEGITPVVPAEGSVGASGDLTPMSYIGAALAGERDVFYEDDIMPSLKAMKKAGLKPYQISAEGTAFHGKWHNDHDRHCRTDGWEGIPHPGCSDCRHGAQCPRDEGQRPSLSSGDFRGQAVSRPGLCCEKDNSSSACQSISPSTGRRRARNPAGSLLTALRAASAGCVV
ncbi:MAG: aromatic amino acid lyase [Deltaproteobacteria bacterium]|nr:MAG: aromatic amino acid lyase [Deltaproteobacteria bacterium]